MPHHIPPADSRIALRHPALLGALALGVLADLLLPVPGRPGLNLTLWALAGVAVLAWLMRRRGAASAMESRWLIAGSAGFAIALSLRDADALAVFGLFAAIALLGLAAGRATAAWASRALPGDLMFCTLRVIALLIAGPLGWGRGDPLAAGDERWKRLALAAVRSLLMASPAVLLLSALLMSADPVFAGIVHGMFAFDIEALLDDAVLIAVIAWLSAGWLRALLVADDETLDRLRIPQPAFAPAEVTTALWIVNLLFLVFMAVQLRYLFGGADLVEVTAGLGYAEYARRGFFELVAATALVLPMLLLADWAAATGSPRATGRLRMTMRLTVVLLVGIIVSAAWRMRLYQQAYGLTELRLYVSVFIVWLTAVLGWLVATVLRGRRERFTFGAIVAGLACIASLHAMNPHAMITRINIDRAAAGADVDTGYLRTLSADAVPTLIERLPRLEAAECRHVEAMLEQRWGGERPGGWRAWNLGDWRARRAVAGLSGPSPCSTSGTPGPPSRDDGGPDSRRDR